MLTKTKEKLPLKDELFNPKKIEMIANEIKEVYPAFKASQFTKATLDKFSKLELKERIYHIRNMLHKYLPNDYQEAVNILIQALPPALDPSNNDDDFGDFIYAPYSEYVTAYGCNEKYLDFSLDALREITKRFSVEFALRNFINLYPTQTLAMLEACAKSENYHQRRLASEGLRPKLPWAKKLTIDYHEGIKLLELLYHDNTRYVTRSVANHLNDIAKIDAPLVIETLKRWKKSQKQETKEMDFIIRHALRTLVKQGDEDALLMLGYSKTPPIKVKKIRLHTPNVKVGGALAFEVEIVAEEDTMLMVDYVVHFQTKSGKLSPKVHKLKKLELVQGENIVLKKRHPLRANMTTRTLYAGEHLLEVQVNGSIVYSKCFELGV